MIKKLKGLLWLVTLLGIICTGVVLAGSTFDYGNVPGNLPVGEVNWIAWLDKEVQPGGYPSEILTEDNTNSNLGVDQGYQIFGGVPRWVMQVENFSNPQAGDGITIILGGIGNSSGNIWNDEFNWDTLSSSTDQGTAVLDGVDPCPVIHNLDVNGVAKEFDWSGVSGTYYIYRSNQPSGAGNIASNGRYSYLATVTSPDGFAVYTDSPDFASWYIVIPGIGPENSIDGCHSNEIAAPSTPVINFEATPSDDDVLLTWETQSERNLVGFNLFRSTTMNGSRQLINSLPIDAMHPGTLNGDSYEYRDQGLTDKGYYYWIQLLENDGPKTPFGPREAILSTEQKLYLPMLTHNG